MREGGLFMLCYHSIKCNQLKLNLQFHLLVVFNQRGKTWRSLYDIDVAIMQINIVYLMKVCGQYNARLYIVCYVATLCCKQLQHKVPIARNQQKNKPMTSPSPPLLFCTEENQDCTWFDNGLNHMPRIPDVYG